ncbi:MAG: amidohydrolase family protein [Acidobacteriota bacterium]|nr:amidohydrolase family protein [Acidobacteriota bacterium]
MSHIDIAVSAALSLMGIAGPMEPLEPMRGPYSAVTGNNREGGFPESGWFPGQRPAMAEAVELFIAGSACASFEENLKGSPEVGEPADMPVFSEGLFAIDPEEILTTEALYTIPGGKIADQKRA